ncbi:AraC-type DNA-binding protein [Pilibacter termitis]|uniref:AraC-type DNA-binding protein n=1 Tax=Pilibacter termitis TaxID=263852 RepID=A0A1T4KQJ5_9ENTE|nr:helix-turn-helix domain-containing protein [Pilibacter termitis]SJZ44653.1 AraC-type DNA-binding protein [Pilibacter termitis]
MPLHKIAEEYLLSFTNIEKKQRETKCLVPDFERSKLAASNEKDIRLLNHFFLKNNRISISKHNRFADYPEHSHEFLELNYLLRGHCKQTINGEPFELKKGDILLFDKNCKHSIFALDEEDILINIIFPQDKLDLDWMFSLKKENNTLFHFLIQDFSCHAKGKFIHFKASENEDLQEILCQMINKYFTDSAFSYDILKFYIPILFMELIGNTRYEIVGGLCKETNNEITFQCFKFIEENYQDLTLETLAKLVGYNKNYLSNFLKVKTGKTFTELINQEKLRHAVFLLETTSLSVQHICDATGFSSRNYFYRVFCEQFQMTPMIYRKQKRKA